MADKIIVGILIAMFAIAFGWSIVQLISEVKSLIEYYKKGEK